MDKGLITERVREIAARVAEANGIELVHVELAGIKRDAVVRIYIDKEGGVTLDDCSTVSRGVEAILDIEDFISSKYVLEVSSPGIERQLYSVSDFSKFVGHLAKVKLKQGVGGQKTLVGTIAAVDGSEITMAVRTSGTVRFDYEDVDKANLKIDLSREFGRGRSESSER